MPELSIRFTSDEKVEDSPISVSLLRLDTAKSTNPAPFAPPLDDAQLGDIRWYLEEFSTWPTGPDYERAERIEAGLEDWGRALLTSVTGERDAVKLWQQFVDAPDEGKLLTIDATDPRVLRLPWELLADDGGHIFARGIGVRRRLQQATTGKTQSFELPVRVLVAVSRPEGADFIDPRAVSRPLLDALDELGDRAAIEFLYPPTLTALTERLRDKQAPTVHIVHFDGHGVYDATLGLGYLLFETDEHKPNRVDANRLGTLLFDCGVPLMVLNACQSAQQKEANPYASVAARLIRAGVGSVLAMNYSVLVAAARKFVAAFYGELADGCTVGQAVDAGRFKLLSDEVRHMLTRRDAQGELVEEAVRLRDWFLPALYQQSADPTVFPPVPPSSSQATREPVKSLPLALTDPHSPGGLPAEPLHGFHGRSRELLLLERALAEKSIVVLHGFGGMGKTALAAEAGRWFHRTGRFPGGAAFVSFEGGGSLQQLCSWVGQAVSGDPDFGLGEGDPVERVAQLLRQHPALVILDNFESVLGCEPLMPAEELKVVLDAVWRWGDTETRRRGDTGMRRHAQADKGSRILITTRDTTFNDARFSPSKACAHVELGGLEGDDALELAAAVLADHGIDRAAVDRQGLRDLMGFLGGHPLSLYLVLPHLRRHSPAELIQHFEELLPGFKTGKARERNESLAVSLDFSLRRLGEATRAALPDLAVFQGCAFESRVLEITGIDAELWKTARAELEAAALVTVESLTNINFPFLRFHPTLVPYLAARLATARRAELEERYWKRYYATASYLYESDTQHPHEARAIARREMPNLLRAFDLALAAGAAAEAVGFADSINRFLDYFGRWRERDKLLEKISNLKSQISNVQGVTKSEYLMLSQRGEVLWQQGRAAEAEKVFRDLLARLEAGAAYDAAYDHAVTLIRLCRCLTTQGRPTQAIELYEQALREFGQLSELNDSVKHMMAVSEAEWAITLIAIGQFNEAQEHFEAALPIFREVGDHRSIGVTLGRLGELALERSDLEEAKRLYTESLEIDRTLGQQQGEAVSWNQLGLVAQESKDWEQAEHCYRESLRLRESCGDIAGQVLTCRNLGNIARFSGRLADAELWYLRALGISDQLGNKKQSAADCTNLASLYLSQRRLDEAARYARRAVEIVEQGQIQTEVWKMYSILAQIAQAQGRADEAAQWRRKEHESRDAYAGTQYELRPILRKFQQVISAVVAGCQGNAQAKAQVEASFDTFRQGNWQIVDAIQRIWAGERDEEALMADIDYNSRAIVLAILRQLAGEGTPTPNPSPAGAGEGESAHPAPVLGADGAQAGAGEGADAAIARIRRQWNDVIQAVVAASEGNAQAAAQLEPFLNQMSQKDDWRNLVAVLRRILAGERDPLALLPGLDDTDIVIAGDVLRGLGIDVPLAGQEEEEGDDQGDMVKLDDFLAMILQACRPDAPAGLGEQLWKATRGMATQPNAPDGARELGRVLNEILSGERDPDLSALPPKLADKVWGVLDALGS